MRWPKWSHSLVIVLLPWGAHACVAQPVVDAHRRLEVEMGGGLALPMGNLAGRYAEDASGQALFIGSAKSGYTLSARATYWFAPRFAGSVSYSASRHPGEITVYGKLPWVCESCGHGYVPPSTVHEAWTTGQWSTGAMIAQGVFLAYDDAARIMIRVGAGYQVIAVPLQLNEETGTQYIIIGVPPYTQGTYARSFVQESIRATGVVGALGSTVSFGLARGIDLVTSVDLLVGEVRLKGTQVGRFDGATQSDPDEHGSTEYPVDHAMGTTRLIVQAGLTVDLFRKQAVTP